MAAAMTKEEAEAAYTAATAAFDNDKTFEKLSDKCTKGIKKLTANIDTAISTDKKDDLLAEIKKFQDFFDPLIADITSVIDAPPPDKPKIANIYKILKEGADSLVKQLALEEAQKAALKIEDSDNVIINSGIEYLKLKAKEFTPKTDDKSPPAGNAAGAAAVSGTEVDKYKGLLRTLTENEEIVTTLANAVATSIERLGKANPPAAGGTQRVGTKKRKRRKRRGKGTGKNKPLSEVNVVL
jgi:hypothetical protein